MINLWDSFFNYVDTKTPEHLNLITWLLAIVACSFGAAGLFAAKVAPPHPVSLLEIVFWVLAGAAFLLQLAIFVARCQQERP